MKANNTIYLIMLTIFCLSAMSCNKYLDAKPDKSLATISTLDDAQSLLNSDLMYQLDLGIGEASADNFYVTYTDYQSLLSNPVFIYNARQYTWEKVNLFSPGGNDWSNCYGSHIYRTNTVLDNLPKIDRNSDRTRWDNVKGMALFFRARNYLHMAYTWIQAYDPATAKTDLGLPLRLNADFNEKSVRSSIENTYGQIINDLTAAIPLLPVQAVHPVSPSKPGAYALLAETYLSMRKYKEAGLYADSCLRLYNKLMDFNDTKIINPTAAYPIPRFNAEVLVESVMNTPGSLQDVRCKIDSVLYQSYDDNDLRKTIFFTKNTDNSYRFRGSYEQGLNLFSGLATDEMYLIRAEASARAGNSDAAMNDLNTLLITRWKTGTFVRFTATDANDALQKVLTERRKELLMRGLRWPDLKRFNKDGANITLKRVLNGQIYTLPPNDPGYAIEFPEDVIALSGMQQNP
ncbi:MAG TPA: RagB/SusD family nutrient uptake outer membrane protein [Pedobacter sp.]